LRVLRGTERPLDDDLEAVGSVDGGEGGEGDEGFGAVEVDPGVVGEDAAKGLWGLGDGGGQGGAVDAEGAVAGVVELDGSVGGVGEPGRAPGRGCCSGFGSGVGVGAEDAREFVYCLR